MHDETTDDNTESAAIAKTEAIGQLQNAIQELESGKGLSALTGGHGIQSRTFEFSWTTPTLEISYTMPYGRVLDDDETRQEDDAAIGAACRLAILLIKADDDGSLLAEGETAMSVSFDKLTGAHYQTTDADREIVDSGDDWSGLVARLERVSQSNDSEVMSIIWP